VGTGESKSVLEMALLIKQRCSKVLGFEPEVLYKQGESDETYPKLIYRTDHLTSLDININNLDNIVELDKLLQFSKTTFNPI
jgi:hypothetical protein